MSVKKNPPPLIMVIDDEAINRELMEAALETGGYRVVMANTAIKALDLVSREVPDLAVIDVRLHADMNGYDLCRKLKSTPETKHMIVVMITALEAIHERSKAKAAGADDLVSRMIDIIELLDRIETLLSQRDQQV